jgi:YVTN family beta-propeller protein
MTLKEDKMKWPYFGAAVMLLIVATGRAQYVEDSVDCGANGAGSLCYNSMAGVVYGAAQYGPFFAISAESNKVVSSTAFDFPIWVVYDSLDNKAYCFVRTNDYDTLMVMDGTTHRRIGQIPLEWADRGVWNPDNNRLYVTMGEMDKVAVVDCSGDTVIAMIRTGQYPLGITLNRQHQKLYVLNTDGESMSIINLITNEVIRTIRLNNVPQAGCYSTVADKYYCGLSREVDVIDGVGDTVMSRVAVADVPTAMVENPMHDLVLVAVGDSVLAVSTSADTVVARLQVGRHPWNLVWSSTTDQVYTANYSQDVTALAGDGSQVRRVVPVGHDPHALALAPGHGRLYVGHLGSRFVYVIRDTVSGVQEEPPAGPRLCAGLTASPNPFRRQVTVECGPNETGVLVYARDGRVVADMRLSPNHGRYSWDGRTASGEEAPSGVYFAVTRSGVHRARMVKL